MHVLKHCLCIIRSYTHPRGLQQGKNCLQDFQRFQGQSYDKNWKFTEIYDDFAKDFKSGLQDFQLVADPRTHQSVNVRRPHRNPLHTIHIIAK